jgi:hypothetical protein
VWDGKPARSNGGTADVVAYAREHGHPGARDLTRRRTALLRSAGGPAHAPSAGLQREPPARFGGWVLSHEVKVHGDLLEQVSDGVGQLGMGGGEVGSGSGFASPGLGHCLAEEFMVDLPQ